MVIESFTGPYEFLSNFFYLPTPFVYHGFKVKTSEHAFQIPKTLDPVRRKLIATAPTPSECKRVANNRQQTVRRPDWEEIKIDVMREVLKLKFKDPFLRGCLLGTGTAELIEGNTWGDRFWGTVNGEGENHLGRLLMERRFHIQKKLGWL